VACLVSLERWSFTNPTDHADKLLELRVTQVFRREAGEWRLVHRHADPLIHKRSEADPKLGPAGRVRGDLAFPLT
jgi:hypothetical protein